MVEFSFEETSCIAMSFFAGSSSPNATPGTADGLEVVGVVALGTVVVGSSAVVDVTGTSVDAVLSSSSSNIVDGVVASSVSELLSLSPLGVDSSSFTCFEQRELCF